MLDERAACVQAASLERHVTCNYQEEAAGHVQQHSRRTSGRKQSQVPENVENLVKQIMGKTLACAIQSFKQAHFHSLTDFLSGNVQL